MRDTKVPYIPPELVDYLAELYPDRCPNLTASDRDIWFNAGQAQVVRKLRSLVATQQNNILTEI